MLALGFIFFLYSNFSYSENLCFQSALKSEVETKDSSLDSLTTQELRDRLRAGIEVDKTLVGGLPLSKSDILFRIHQTAFESLSERLPQRVIKGYLETTNWKSIKNYHSNEAVLRADVFLESFLEWVPKDKKKLKDFAKKNALTLEEATQIYQFADGIQGESVQGVRKLLQIVFGFNEASMQNLKFVDQKNVQFQKILPPVFQTPGEALKFYKTCSDRRLRYRLEKFEYNLPVEEELALIQSGRFPDLTRSIELVESVAKDNYKNFKRSVLEENLQKGFDKDVLLSRKSVVKSKIEIIEDRLSLGTKDQSATAHGATEEVLDLHEINVFIKDVEVSDVRRHQYQTKAETIGEKLQKKAYTKSEKEAQLYEIKNEIDSMTDFNPKDKNDIEFVRLVSKAVALHIEDLDQTILKKFSKKSSFFSLFKKELKNYHSYDTIVDFLMLQSLQAMVSGFFGSMLGGLLGSVHTWATGGSEVSMGFLISGILGFHAFQNLLPLVSWKEFATSSTTAKWMKKRIHETTLEKTPFSAGASYDEIQKANSQTLKKYLVELRGIEKQLDQKYESIKIVYTDEK